MSELKLPRKPVAPTYNPLSMSNPVIANRYGIRMVKYLKKKANYDSIKEKMVHGNKKK